MAAFALAILLGLLPPARAASKCEAFVAKVPQSQAWKVLRLSGFLAKYPDYFQYCGPACIVNAIQAITLMTGIPAPAPENLFVPLIEELGPNRPATNLVQKIKDVLAVSFPELNAEVEFRSISGIVPSDAAVEHLKELAPADLRGSENQIVFVLSAVLNEDKMPIRPQGHVQIFLPSVDDEKFHVLDPANPFVDVQLKVVGQMTVNGDTVPTLRYENGTQPIGGHYNLPVGTITIHLLGRRSIATEF